MVKVLSDLRQKDVSQKSMVQGMTIEITKSNSHKIKETKRSAMFVKVLSFDNDYSDSNARSAELMFVVVETDGLPFFRFLTST
jgi:hypothetical protein